MNKHCKAKSGETGTCPTCGDIFHGEPKECLIAVNDYDGEWVYPATTIGDKLVMALIVVAGLAGLTKALGWW